MRQLFGLLSLTILVMWSASAAELTKLKIVVTNASGKPVARANVIVSFGGHLDPKHRKTMHTSWEMHSSQEGVADIPDMPKGKILVQVVGKGYQTFGQSYDVAEDQRTIEVQLNPPQSQYSAH